MVSFVKQALRAEGIPKGTAEGIPEGTAEALLLIPKVEKLSEVSQFRPINLCNVTYKIVTKVIVNRLKNVWKEIISSNQTSFILGR